MNTRKCIFKINFIASIVLSTLFVASNAMADKAITVAHDSNSPQSSFAVEELRTALSKRGYAIRFTEAGSADIILFSAASAPILKMMRESVGGSDVQLEPEGFSIRKSSDGTIWVLGSDPAGVMYGGLELAEQVRVYGLEGIRETDQNPFMKKRGIKFNIPLDVRTPSYTDMSDAAQQNIAEMWSFDFWREQIDHLAKYRYNMISLWSLHPFPSLIQVPEYPDIALNDVKRSTARFDEYYSTRAIGFDAPEILQNTETLLTLSIDEKIAFWKHVMRYAKERNINFYLVTWNVYTYGIDGKYGITDDLNNATTKDYFRKSVKQLFLTYPDLAGIGLTTGENMGKGKEGFELKEDWVFDTYAQGVLDVAKEQPDRKIAFIHRQHEAGTAYIARKFAPLSEHKNIEFLYSFKYAQAHALSSTKQAFHEKFVGEIGQTKTLWTLRNDDNYYFRWGAPDFVREFLTNIPRGVSAGFYYGSDQYVWGREFLGKDAKTPHQLEIEKHWYHWMLWGRLGYDPGISNERFTAILQDRFPQIDAAALFTAWQDASMIYPLTTGFHWGALDYHWYIEGCKSRPDPAKTASGFHDVNRFITLPPHPKTGYQSIPEYVNMIVAKDSSGLISPFAISHQLHAHADKALTVAKTIPLENNDELSNTIHDIETMAYLGKYYAHKISGAVHLALYRETKDSAAQHEAVKQLTHALTFWNTYVASATMRYKNPLWTNRVGIVDWVELTEEVRKDIEVAKRRN